MRIIIFDRTEYRRRQHERERRGVGRCLARTPSDLATVTTTRVNVNYIKAPSGPSALIWASLYLAYDDEPARNSSARLE